ALRRTILEAMGVAGDVEGLSQAARADQDPALRRAAIQGLGVASSPAATAALKQIYAANADPGIRRAVIEGLFVADDARALIDLFRAEKDRELKHDIIQKLSLMDSPEATDMLLKLLEQ
ncbi:MAG TPA: HEAT repeat domain-containing protein, partial [Thermoanaerobaculia bacterium]|nr:HEAT repeat domain-containing protein [Thermoanaerobaculia bacterium]